MDGKWLSQKLAQNGFTPADLAKQTGLDLQTIEQVINNQSADEQTWNLILDTLNLYPRVTVPSEQVLLDLKNDIDTYGSDAACIVFYSVNQNQLAFCEYRPLENMTMHGGNVPTQFLSQMQITLGEALDLFTKQNFASQKYTD